MTNPPEFPIQTDENEYIADHPKYLHNTDFMILPPKPIINYLVDLIEGFMEHHEMSVADFERYFFTEGSKAFFHYKSEKQFMSIYKAQDMTIDMYIFDKKIYKNKRDRFFEKRPPMFVDEFVRLFASFCKRHRIPKHIGSEILLRDKEKYGKFRRGLTNISSNTMHRVMQEMHYSDLQLIESMGRNYVLWALENKKRMPRGYRKKIKEYGITEY